MSVTWTHDDDAVDWDELSELYRVAPLGEKSPDDLRASFGASRFKCFLRDEGRLIGAGRALADGVDCAYICDVALHPDYQGRGLGGRIVARLVELSAGHRKVLLYSVPGSEGFYRKLGFKRMRTAMAIFSDQEYALQSGLVVDD